MYSDGDNEFLSEVQDLLQTTANISINPALVIKFTWDNMKPSHASFVSEVMFMLSEALRHFYMQIQA